MLGRNFSRYPVRLPVRNPVVDGAGSEDELCALRNYIAAQEQQSSCVITDNNFDVTSLVGTGSGGFSCFIVGDSIIDLEDDKAWGEIQVTAADCAGCGGGIIAQVGTGKGAEIFGIAAFGLGGVGTGIIVDLDFTVLASGLTLPFGWTVQLRLDGTTGDISWEDSEGNGAFLINSPDLLATQQFNFGAIGGGQDPINIGDTVSMIINENYFAPTIPLPAGYKGYCNLGPDPRPELCGTLVGLGDLFGIPPSGVVITQDDIDWEVTNNGSIQSESYVLLTDDTFATELVPAFIELTYEGADNIGSDNWVGGTFATFAGLFGVGLGVFPNTQVGDNGALAFFPSGQRLLGEQMTFTDVGGNSPDEFVFAYVSGGFNSNLDSIGIIEELGSVAGGGGNDSIYTSEGVIQVQDYSASNLSFTIALGAIPAQAIVISSVNADADALALDIQTQLQVNPAYANVTVSKTSIGIDIQNGYSIIMGLDAPNENFFYNDSLGNTALLDLNNYFDPQTLQIITGVSLAYFAVGRVAAGNIPRSVRFSYNAGKYIPLLSIPEEYKGHCNVGAGNKLYAFFNFAADGNVQQINNGRTDVLTNDIAEADNPAVVSVFSDFIFSPTTFTVNCFEAEITYIDPSVLEEQWQVGLNAVINTDMRFTREGTGNGLSLEQEFPANNFITLANNMPDFALGDTMSVCVFDNGPFPITPDMQVVIKVGADLVIYDKIKMAAPLTGNPPYTAFTELNNPFGGSGDNLPDGNRVEVTFNGIDGDYSVTDYPPDFLNFNGDPMPSSIDLGYQRSAEFVIWNWTFDSDRVVNYTNSNKALEIVNGTTQSNDLIGHLPLFVKTSDGIVVVGMKIDTASGFFSFEANGIQYDDSKVFIRDVGGGILGMSTIIGGVTVNTSIKLHTLVANDEIYLQFNTDTGMVKAFLWDSVGATVFSTAEVAYDVSEPFSYLMRMHVTAVPISATAKFTSQCKAADMNANVTALLDVGAKDIEGVVIP